MQISIESQAQEGCEVIACFFTISGAMLGSNRLFLDLFGRDAWELEGLTSAKIALRL